MKRLALGLAAGALIIAAPLTSHAGGCAGTAAPKPHSGSTKQSLAPADPGGTAWVYNDTSPSGEAGLAGSHGWLVARGGSGGVSVSGYQTESNVNGSVSVSPNASASNPRLAVSECLADN